MRSKAAAAKQAASQPNRAGNQREAGLRAAMMAPLSSNLGRPSDQSGKIIQEKMSSRVTGKAEPLARQLINSKFRHDGHDNAAVDLQTHLSLACTEIIVWQQGACFKAILAVF